MIIFSYGGDKARMGMLIQNTFSFICTVHKIFFHKILISLCIHKKG